MSTIELLTPATHPDGWRQVRAPGGHESWNFSVISSDGRTQVMAGLHLGHPRDRAYGRRYAWYRMFPTRVKPPVPVDYPSISLVVLEGDRTLWSMLQTERGAEFSAATDRGKVRIGGSHFETMGDGSLHLGLRGQVRARTATADLVFRPQGIATGIATGIAAGEAAGEEAGEEVRDGPQRMVMVAPSCEVEGEVSVFDANGSPRVIGIAGSGTHTHGFSTRMMRSVESKGDPG